MDKVIARFKVDSIEDFGDYKTINMSPVYSNDPNHPNKRFWDATPSGKLEMHIRNLPAAEMFEVKKEYNIEFTPVE